MIQSNSPRSLPKPIIEELENEQLLSKPWNDAEANVKRFT